jgi:hypothetical protein
VIQPIIVIPAATAGIGLWVLVTGRTFRGLPGWPLDGASLRLAGAYDLLGSLVVVALAVAGKVGLAFVTYAVLTLVLAAMVTVASRLKPS